jgi:hypothetical protein
MKKFLAVACFALVALVAMTPKAHAGGRVIVSVGFGGGYYGGYSPYYYGYGAPCYPYGPCVSPWAVPYAGPFVTFGYVPPARYYRAPIHGYTLYPRYSVRPAPVRQDLRGPGAYASRVYRRYNR